MKTATLSSNTFKAILAYGFHENTFQNSGADWPSFELKHKDYELWFHIMFDRVPQTSNQREYSFDYGCHRAINGGEDYIEYTLTDEQLKTIKNMLYEKQNEYIEQEFEEEAQSEASERDYNEKMSDVALNWFYR